MKELEYIETIKNTICDSSYIGNDTAYIKERNIIATKDILVEDTHFRLDTISPYDLGYKAVSVNLSDIAAAAAMPEFLIIGLAIPKKLDKSFIEEFYKGADYLAKNFNVKIIGGDITSSEKLFISITAIGKMMYKSISGREFAKEGQVIALTGEHGNSKAGLELLEKKLEHRSKNFFIKSHINPYPKIEEGLNIARVSKENFALMDTSDGLADALYKMAKASGVTFKIDYYLIPINPDLLVIADMTNQTLDDFIFYGGEDYELLACLNQETYKALIEQGMNLYKIGEVVKQKENIPVEVYSKGEILYTITSLDSTFDHFK